MNKRLFFLAWFWLLFFGTVFANPFTQKENSPAPVQMEQPSETVVNGMRFLSGQLAQYIEAWKTEPSASLLFITLGIAFAYGFIHALAPGHRKIVVFTFFLSRNAHAYEPAVLGLTLAALHAFSSLVLMLIFKTISGAISVTANNAGVYMEGMTFIILILLSLYGIVEAIFSIRKKTTEEKNIKRTAIMLSSLYPCPAAMLILVFTTNMQVFSLGVAALIALSLGMSVPIIVSGYAAWAGRTALFNHIRENKRMLTAVAAILQITAFSFLLFISLKIAYPFIRGLF